MACIKETTISKYKIPLFTWKFIYIDPWLALTETNRFFKLFLISKDTILLFKTNTNSITITKVKFNLYKVFETVVVRGS